MTQSSLPHDSYKFGFRKPENYVFKSKKGLDRSVVVDMSDRKKIPHGCGSSVSKRLINFSGNHYPHGVVIFRPSILMISTTILIRQKGLRRVGKIFRWKSAIPMTGSVFPRQKKFLSGVSAQYESEVVYKSIHETLSKKGVIFLDMDSGLREFPEIVKQYFGTVIPPGDNKFSALNSAVWSGGSFVYVPKGVRVDLPLQAYFRINAANMGQFERTLIIAEEGSFVHYVEGCTAPIYTTDSLHSAVVEIIVKKGARVRYTTIQNWSTNVYNLVTKRARVEEEGVMEWVDGNLGCLAEGSLLTTPQGIIPIEKD